MQTLIDFNKILNELKYPSELFEKYFNYQDKFLSTEIKQIDQELSKKVEGLNIEEEVYWINMYKEFHLDYLNGTFPDIQNKTSMIILYNTFENNLILLCKVLGEKLRTPIIYSELSGDVSIKCQKFLIKFCGVNSYLFENENWKKIDCIRRLRNSIVHNNSEILSIQKKHKKIIDEFKKIDGFVVLDSAFGLLKSDILRLFLKIINNFFEDLKIELSTTQKSIVN